LPVDVDQGIEVCERGGPAPRDRVETNAAPPKLAARAAVDQHAAAGLELDRASGRAGSEGSRLTLGVPLGGMVRHRTSPGRRGGSAPHSADPAMSRESPRRYFVPLKCSRPGL